MKSSFVALILVLTVFMLFLTNRARQKNTVLAKSLVFLTHSVVLVTMFEIIAMLIPNEEAAKLFVVLHHISTEWLLIFLMAFLERYTDVVKATKFSRSCVALASVVVSVAMIVSLYHGNIVACDYKTVDGITYRVFSSGGTGYLLHCIFSYSIALVGVLILFFAMQKTIRFYKIKYLPATVAMIIVIILEAVCNLKSVCMDYALFGYIFLAIFLIYITLYHEFKGLIADTLSYVNDSSNSGILCFNLYGECIYANERMKIWYPECSELSDFEEQYTKDIERYNLKYAETKVWNVERLVGDYIRHLEITFSKVYDKHKDYIGSSLLIYDKTDDVLAYEKASYGATHDSLTDLYNSEAFYQMISARRINEREEAYLVAADIKEFKLINDFYGYDKGDDVLRAFASTMKTALSYRSICCRQNSDRYAFYIPVEEFSEEYIKESIEPIQNMLERDSEQIHFHFGVYKITDEDDNPSLMYDHARIALNLIKNEYDRVFSYYDEDMMKRMIRERQLIDDFEDAIANKEFKMFLQPQIGRDGQVVGSEALVRWKPTEDTMISPGEFIPLFEKSGLIHRLDKYMWEEAAIKLKEWQSNGLGEYHISVNISPTDFYYLDVYSTIVSIAEKYQIDPSKLKLEITESAFMNDPEKQLALIAKLQQYGFAVEIDDFGSGYSSLSMLKDMKANVLKIDMRFLSKTSDVDRAIIIIKDIIRMAQNLNMLVVTEGVEDIEQFNFLKDAGCDVFQGFYFDRPIPVEEFENKYFKR